ncbi:MAG: hypothetical protein QXO71_11200 [Candidatus Jordarchaeaceae archaeon]
MSSKERDSGISPLHVPGSVTRFEARNLYYGEQYDHQALASFSIQLLNSLCVGDAISIYTDDEELLDWINSVLTRSFGGRHITEARTLKDLKIHRVSEREKSYIVLFKFLLWIYTYYERVSNEDEKTLLQQIITRIRNTNIIMYLVPSEKAKYRTILIPRLEYFFTRWIDKEEKRNALIRLRNNFYNFSSEMWEKGKDAQKIIEIFTDEYESFCHGLLKYGVPNHEKLREMINIVIDAQRKYGGKLIGMSFIREMSL